MIIVEREKGHRSASAMYVTGSTLQIWMIPYVMTGIVLGKFSRVC
jgi:hypothetical protein